MKTHSLLISFLMLLVIMGACSSGPVMRNATGFAYEIVVTMDGMLLPERLSKPN